MLEQVPVFVYGSLRPGELAHRQIASLVGSTEDGEALAYGLSVRDGLPFMHRAAGLTVSGVVLWAEAGRTEELLRRVRDYEGNDLYSERSIEVRLRNGKLIRAQTFVGRKPGRGRAIPLDGRWSSAEDPLFRGALDAIAKMMLLHIEHVRPMPADMNGFWDAFLPLQGGYLTLCTVLERYTTFVFGPHLDPGERIKRLRDDSDALRAVSQANPPEITIVDSRNPTATVNVPGARPFDAWYRVRSNLSHRGKAGFVDFELVERSIVGLHDSLRLLLGTQLPFNEHERHEFARAERMLRPVYQRFREQR